MAQTKRTRTRATLRTPAQETLDAHIKRATRTREQALEAVNKVYPPENRRGKRDYASYFLLTTLRDQAMPVNDLIKLATKENPPISQMTLRRAFKQEHGIAFRRRRVVKEKAGKRAFRAWGTFRQTRNEVHWRLPDDQADAQWLLAFIGDKRIHINSIMSEARSRGITRGRIQRLADENDIDTSDFKWSVK